MVSLYILASAQCSWKVVPQAVTSSGCNFQRTPSDLGAWAFEKGIKKNLWQSFYSFSLNTVRFAQPEKLFLFLLSVSAVKSIILEKGRFMHFVSIYAFCILLPGLVCGILSFVTSHCWYVCAASADASWLHCMFPKIQTSEQQDSMKKGVKRK